MVLRALFALTAAAVLVVSVAAATDQCRGSKTELDLLMGTNKTGFWSASVRLHQPSTLGSRSPPPVAVRAEPSVSVCGNVRTDILLVTLERPPPFPLPEYTYFPGVGSYKLHSTKVTWERAKAACEQEGAHLVIINSEEEAASIRELIKSSTGNSFSAGFNDLAHEGSFLTIFGQPLADTGYIKWHTGNPDDEKNNEDCGSVTKGALLNDIPCSSNAEFICEQLNL